MYGRFSRGTLHRWLGALTLLLASTAPLAGQTSGSEPEDTAKVVVLDPVVVTVNHLEVLRSRVPNSVSVVTREEIRESGAASVLSVVNERVPGLFVTERGVLGYGVSQGAAGRISIRGAGATPNTQVLVMTDGRPQMMGLFGHPIPDTHVASGVERVEVVRGPSSVLYGTGAMGGVVNVITRRQWKPGLDVEAGATYGSFETHRQELALGYGFGDRSGVLLAGNRYRTAGHRPWSSFEVDNLTARASTALGGGLALVGDAAVSDLRTFDPGTVAQPRVDNWVDILRSSSGVALENRGGRLVGATRAFFNFGRHEVHDGFRSRDYTLGAQLHQGVILGGGSTLTVGADIKRFGGEAENVDRGMDWGSHEVDESGIFALLHQPLPGELVATGGVRLNHHSAYGVEVAPQLGVALPLGAGSSLRASSGRGFRSPTIRELFLFPAPNPELEPERAWSNEVSLLHAFGERLSLEVAVYRMEGSNLILTTGAFPNLTLSNSGRFVHRGAEVALTAAPLDRLRLDLSYGYLDAGELTLSHPEHQLFGAARYDFGRLTTHLRVQHVAGLYAADGAQGRLPDYTVVGARLAYPLPGGMVAHLSGENLLDAEYQVMQGYPMPGRVISAGLQLRGW